MLFASLQDELLILDKKIEEIEVQVKQMAKTNETCERLMKVPGVGVLTANNPKKRQIWGGSCASQQNCTNNLEYSGQRLGI